MVAASVTPLERQQLETTARATYWHRVRFELVDRQARRHGATALLDIGAGSGLLGAWLAAARPDLDYRFEETSPVLHDALVARFGPAASAAPGEVVAAGTLVAMLDVLEHIADADGALAELHDRMAPGTSLVVTVPAMQWAFSSWDTELGHHRRYTRRQLRTQLAAAGFDVDTVAYLFPELFPLLVARKLRRRPRQGVDFPALPPALEAIGYGIATATTATRRVWPVGTSVVAVARRGS